jgi:hypothetical protein
MVICHGQVTTALLVLACGGALLIGAGSWWLRNVRVLTGGTLVALAIQAVL